MRHLGNMYSVQSTNIYLDDLLLFYGVPLLLTVDPALTLFMLKFLELMKNM